MEGRSREGDVVLIANDREREGALRAALGSSGPRVTALSCAEAVLLERGDSEELDLVVTSFEPEDSASSAVLGRLLTGDLFPGVPRLHLCSSSALRDHLLGGGVDATRVLVVPDEQADLPARARLLTEVGGLTRKLVQASTLDALTGLYNRRYLLQRLDEELSRARRYRTPLSLVLI